MTQNTAPPSVRESFAIGLAAASPDATPHTWKRIIVPNVAGLLALVLLPLVAVGMPWQGWALAFAAWLINRIAHVITVRFTNTLEVTMAVGAAGIAMMFRVWIIVAAFFIVGRFVDRQWALWGMGLFFILITVDIGTRIIMEVIRNKASKTSTTDEAFVEEPAT